MILLYRESLQAGLLKSKNTPHPTPPMKWLQFPSTLGGNHTGVKLLTLALRDLSLVLGGDGVWTGEIAQQGCSSTEATL